MKICTITPDRGDRPQFTEFCKFQLKRMGCENNYFISYKPFSDEFDLSQRLQLGFEMAKKDGFDWAFIIENDDYYPADYFKGIDLEVDFIGLPMTWYYNLKNKSYQNFTHPERSSLFCTGVRIAALDKFVWPEGVFIDIALWRYAEKFKRDFSFRGKMPIGIKHGIGKCGGKGHKLLMKNTDNDMTWLKTHVDPVAFEFYQSLKWT